MFAMLFLHFVIFCYVLLCFWLFFTTFCNYFAMFYYVLPCFCYALLLDIFLLCYPAVGAPVPACVRYMALPCAPRSIPWANPAGPSLHSHERRTAALARRRRDCAELQPGVQCNQYAKMETVVYFFLGHFRVKNKTRVYCLN